MRLFIKILFLGSIILCNKANSQNLVSNGSFENCKPNVSCTYGQGQFDQVAHWGYFGSGFHFGGVSTPDWGQDPPNTPDGLSVAGIFENEGIFYDFGAGGLPTGLYHLSFWARGNDENATLNISPVNGVSCFLSTVPPSPVNCTNFAGGDIFLLGRRELGSSGDWSKVEIDFPVYNGIVPYRYLVFGTYRNGECDRYVFLDNVIVEDDCCGEFMQYQNTEHLPKYTSRQEFVKAGYDVGCTWQPVGNVTVKSNQNITFQSAGYIEKLPGFNVELGGVFEERIRDCGDVPENALNDTNLIYYPNAAFFTCDGKINNAGFASTGFSYYRVRIFNRWGDKVFDLMGHINEIYQVYTSGEDIYTDISQGVFTIQLELFNCSYHKLEAFSFFYEYVDPCLSASFKNDLNLPSILSSQLAIDGEEVKLYPNPASDLINLWYTTENNSNVSFVIHNEAGQLIYQRDNIPVLNKNQIHVISTNDYAGGTYFLTLLKDQKKYVKKFIVGK